MKYLISLSFLVFSLHINAQMLNDSPFNASVAHPKFKNGKGPKVLIDAAHHNFIVEMGLIKPLMDVVTNDGYQPKIDSALFTKDYLSKYKVVVISPAMPFLFGSKPEVTTETTFTDDELNALHDWVTEGGSLLMLSEHAPIDKSMTPLFNKFGIQLSSGAIYDSLNYDTSVTLSSNVTILKFTTGNGLLNQDHPITTGENKNEKINNIETYTGSSLQGEGYANIFKLAPSAKMKKWNRGLPANLGNSQGLAGNVGKGKVAAFGDCNGFTAMYVKANAGQKFSAGMQVAAYDWKQFALNTFHWLSK
jgi:hypothetical protein